MSKDLGKDGASRVSGNDITLFQWQILYETNLLCMKNTVYYISNSWDDLQIGKTKVFLRAGQMAELDARRAEVLNNAARIIQRRIQTHYAHRRFIALRKAAILLQSLGRGDMSE